MQTNKDNLIVELSFEFALLIIDFTTLSEQMKKFSLANQLFRSGTSIGANIRETQNTESIENYCFNKESRSIIK
jgi:four helix bundle protein